MHGRFRGTLDQAADSRSQGARHVAAGLALTGAAVAISALMARRDAPGARDRLAHPPAFKPPKAVFGIAWPPLFMALTLSALRLWNAPPSAARTRALSLWTVLQGLNVLWMSYGPRRLGGSQLTAAVATLGTACAYAVEARKVDAPAANLAGPYVGWMGLADMLTARLWRKAA